MRRSNGRLTARVRWRLSRISSLTAGMGNLRLRRRWRSAPAAQFLVGADDALDKRVADDVASGELDDADALEVFQGAMGLEQSRVPVGRQVNLGFVAGDDRLGAVAQSRE